MDVRDGTHDTPKYTQFGYPLITSKNLKPDGIDFSDVSYISEEDHRDISKRSKVDRNDILFAMIGTIGNPVIVETDEEFSVKNVALFKLAKSYIDPVFFKYLLGTPIIQRQLINETRGGTQKFVSLTVLRNMLIPYPLPEEQKRIAAILDKADRVRRKRQEAIRLTEELGRSIFLNMFGEQHNYPKSLVGSICTVKGGKRLPIGHQLVSNDTGYPYIRAGNLKKGTTTGELLYLKQETHQAIKRYTISSDDVYITIVGAYIGDVGIIPIELDGANLTENAAKLVIKDNRVTNYFISYFLRSDIGQRQIKSKIKTTGQPKFALFRIEEIEIPIPPLEMQEKFQLIIENIDKNNYSMSVHYQESENLFNSLLQRAFRGEL